MDVKLSLAAVRVNCNKNQKEWADMLGVTQNTVCSWERGKSAPSAVLLRKISELSGIPMDLIFVQERCE